MDWCNITSFLLPLSLSLSPRLCDVSLLQENPYPAVTMHKTQRSVDSPQSPVSRTPFPLLDEVAVQLFIDHAAAKLKMAPPVVKPELKEMVPSGPPLGECERQIQPHITQAYS